MGDVHLTLMLKSDRPELQAAGWVVSAVHTVHTNPCSTISLSMHYGITVFLTLLLKSTGITITHTTDAHLPLSYWVVTDRWQRFSSLSLSEASVADLAASCDEFLVHGVDVEVGRRGGVADLAASCDEFLVHGVDVEVGSRRGSKDGRGRSGL